MRHGFVATLLALVLSGSASAQPMAADCASLTASLAQVQGYTLTVLPAGPQDGWCVLDGAALRSDVLERPDLTAEKLRLRGTLADGVPMMLEVDMSGLRIRPKAGDRALDDRLRGLFRLQSADLRFLAQADPSTGSLRLENLILRLSGGTEVSLVAEVAGAGAGLAALPGGRLVAMDLTYRSDGRLLRPLMALAGDGLAPGLAENEAVDAARKALLGVVAALPDTILDDESHSALTRAVMALPQGRGRLDLSLRVAEGIGAARLVMVGLAADPLGPKAQAQLLAGAQVSAVWTPGIAP